MSLHRATLICGAALGLAWIAGCGEDQVLPPPPPAAAPEDSGGPPPKEHKPGPGTSRIDPKLSS